MCYMLHRVCVSNVHILYAYIDKFKFFAYLKRIFHQKENYLWTVLYLQQFTKYKRGPNRTSTIYMYTILYSVYLYSLYIIWLYCHCYVLENLPREKWFKWVTHTHTHTYCIGKPRKTYMYNTVFILFVVCMCVVYPSIYYISANT